MEIKQKKLNQKINLNVKFPNPKNLKEIVEFGINNPIFSVNVIAETLHQLKIGKEQSIILVDEFNFLYMPSKI